MEHTGATAIVEPAGPGYVGKTISPNLEADVFTVTVADDIAMVWDADFTACDAGSPTTCAVGGHTWVMNAAAGIRNPGLGGLVTGYTHEGHAVATRTGADETVVSFSYDLVGSMVGSSDGVTMGWDARNRMVTWTDGTTTWWYGYDSGGERRVASDGVTTRYYLDGLEVEVGGDSHITYTHAGQTVAVRDTTTGEVEVVVSDHLGSPQVAWNPTTAVVTGTRGHTPYGGLRTTSGTIPGTVGYTGQHADPTGLAYYGARHYHPDLMVFISADTIIPDPGSAGGLNRYGYVAGNPIRYTDPSGHTALRPACLEDGSHCLGPGALSGHKLESWVVERYMSQGTEPVADREFPPLLDDILRFTAIGSCVVGEVFGGFAPIPFEGGHAYIELGAIIGGPAAAATALSTEAAVILFFPIVVGSAVIVVGFVMIGSHCASSNP